uniref:triple QxxK/R motif-containing protein-like n=1 Tax=Styela clava TaxID=7725 RepID=UPI001939EFD7|nr:triple QxxK/R motif-containing protein-like [Styela clava]
MGKKDSMTRGPIVENYRKRIGKQDYKKSKSAIKEMKTIAEAKKSSTALSDIVLVAVAFSVILALLYVMFYASLAK